MKRSNLNEFWINNSKELKGKGDIIKAISAQIIQDLFEDENLDNLIFYYKSKEVEDLKKVIQSGPFTN